MTTSGFVDVGGGRLFYEEAGEGPAVVLIHPGLWDRRTWDPQFETLAERYRVIRYDVRGFGRSSRPEKPYSHVDDLHRLLTSLGADHVALVGCSMGGMIAIDFTLEHPEMVTALVPVAAGLPGYAWTSDVWEKEAADIGAFLEAGDLDGALEYQLQMWAPLGDNDDAGRRIRDIARDNRHQLTMEGELELELDPPAAKRLGEILVPTLIVLGAQDVDDLNHMWHGVGPQIQGSRTVVIDGADHVVNMRQPEKFNELVLDFLGRESPPSSR